MFPCLIYFKNYYKKLTPNSNDEFKEDSHFRMPDFSA